MADAPRTPWFELTCDFNDLSEAMIRELSNVLANKETDGLMIWRGPYNTMRALEKRGIIEYIGHTSYMGWKHHHPVHIIRFNWIQRRATEEAIEAGVLEI